VLRADGIEVSDQSDSRCVLALGGVHDQAVVKASDRTAPQASAQPMLDVIAELRFLSYRARNPHEGEQGVAKRMRDFRHGAQA
jgi:hypothetical protein